MTAHNADTLRTVGHALFGRDWIADLADLLGVADRTAQRWAAGRVQISPGIWGELADECRRRGKALAGLADTLAPPQAAALRDRKERRSP